MTYPLARMGHAADSCAFSQLPYMIRLTKKRERVYARVCIMDLYLVLNCPLVQRSLLAISFKLSDVSFKVVEPAPQTSDAPRP